jgi:hypothetical protein
VISLGLIIPLELVRNTDILFLLITKLMYEAERMLVFNTQIYRVHWRGYELPQYRHVS